MANDFEVGMDVAAPPDAVWPLAGDPGRIGEWFAPVVACEMDGDAGRSRWAAARCWSSGSSGTTRPLLLLHRAVRHPGADQPQGDHPGRGGPGGSRVLWSQTATSEVEGYDIESRLGGVMTAGLERLRDIVEGRPTA